jgi:adenylate kinase|tara:strand:+ start:311 stop:886 length:576 start_codon:yes stop_codon:yes gene_type:complete
MKSFKQYFFEAINGPKLIMIGGPGSGKSTYSELIKKELGIAHIYTGDMMRDLAKQNTPDGKRVKELLAKGEFAPTPVVIDAVKERMKKPDAQKGYVFDGFPRNIEQAKAMEEKGIEYDYVIYLDVSEEEVVKRLTARGRADDKPDIIKKRLKVFHRETAPLLTYYKDEIMNIKAEGSTPEDIAKSIIAKVK